MGIEKFGQISTIFHLFWIWLLLLLNVPFCVVAKKDPDYGIRFEKLVSSRGFGYEVHRLVTDDGYILTLHRIVLESLHRGRNLKPVILQHGMFGSSSSFLVNSPFIYSRKSKYCNKTMVDPDVDGDYLGDNLGFDLALTKRYDVWLTNSRGAMVGVDDNPGVRHHLNLSTCNPKFWQFSFEEKGLYDLPTFIDYIREQTGHKTVGFCGYSLGTTAAIVLLSMRPEYADILQPVILMAPVIFQKHSYTPARHIAPFTDAFCAKDGKFPFAGDWLSLKIRDSFPGLYFKTVNSAFTGQSRTYLNVSRLSVYLSQTMYSISVRDFCHFVRNYRNGKFARYDFGSTAMNQKRYGQNSAPIYPLNDIRKITKLAFITGTRDYLVAQEDVNGLKKFLKQKTNAKIVMDYVVPVKGWSHMDFVFGIYAGPLVYRKVIEIFDKFTK